jgi:hypothetical protein
VSIVRRIFKVRVLKGERRIKEHQYRVEMAKLISNSDRIDESGYTRSEQIDHVLRTGQAISCNRWKCADGRCIGLPNYVEYGMFYLHCVPVCRCNLNMVPVSIQTNERAA